MPNAAGCEAPPAAGLRRAIVISDVVVSRWRGKASK